MDHRAENTVNWVNQPGANGSPATTASGQGWREWNVAAQMQALFDSGANNGFLIQDANEGGPGAEQSFNSRTHSQNRPQLVFPVRRGAATATAGHHATQHHHRLRTAGIDVSDHRELHVRVE